MLHDVYIPFTKARMGRFLFLLLSMLLMLILRPFLEGYIRITFLMSVFFSVILFSGIYALSRSKGVFITAVILAFPLFLSEWMPFLIDIRVFRHFKNIFGILFYAYAAVIILAHVLKAKDINLDIIVGAICVYFLIGFVWAFAYAILENFQPASFQISENLVPGISSFSYYSFVTLTTLGYGDITPLSSPARSLSLLEAITGQLYLAVLVARLVGLHIARRA